MQPAGVGIGKTPPVYLQPGDTVTVSVNGLGTLTNRIGDEGSSNPIMSKVEAISHLKESNASRIAASDSLTLINDKRLFYRSFGRRSGPPVVFIHGLGGNAEYFSPLITTLHLETSHSLHSFDLEGHGASPTSPLSKLSIQSFAEDVSGVFHQADITAPATLIAHSMGCLVAVQFALWFPEHVDKLILLGPPASPYEESARTAGHARADAIRNHGMQAAFGGPMTAGVSDETKLSNPIAAAAVRLMHLGQDPEGYAKGCAALVDAQALDFSAINPPTLIVTGSADKISQPSRCERYVEGREGEASLRVLPGVGHWHIFEDLQGTAAPIRSFLLGEPEITPSSSADRPGLRKRFSDLSYRYRSPHRS